MKNQKTYMHKKEEVKRNWLLVDVKDNILGHAATDIAQKLIGKNKVNYTPHVDGGDYVVVINAKEVKLSRNKAQKKIYYRHTGFPGGLKKRTFLEMLEKSPERIIQEAVKNMLPKNKLRQNRMSRLKVFAGAQHPYEVEISQVTKK